VIASRVGGVPELVADGITGRLVTAGDSTELSEVIRDLMDNRERLMAMGNAARERVETSGWTWESSAETTNGIYAEVVAGV
jgi:starch synthase